MGDGKPHREFLNSVVGGWRLAVKRKVEIWRLEIFDREPYLAYSLCSISTQQFVSRTYLEIL